MAQASHLYNGRKSHHLLGQTLSHTSLQSSSSAEPTRSQSPPHPRYDENKDRRDTGAAPEVSCRVSAAWHESRSPNAGSSSRNPAPQPNANWRPRDEPPAPSPYHPGEPASCPGRAVSRPGLHTRLYANEQVGPRQILALPARFPRLQDQQTRRFSVTLLVPNFMKSKGCPMVYSQTPGQPCHLVPAGGQGSTATHTPHPFLRVGLGALSWWKQP